MEAVRAFQAFNQARETRPAKLKPANAVPGREGGCMFINVTRLSV
jgi:hypothetical protein